MANRTHIGIFGRMNTGKSSLLNLLTQQNSSIVDACPGTTADTKIVLMELHGLGPVKLFDTAGCDEEGELGGKKRKKVEAVLKECDLALLMIDPLRALSAELSAESALLWEARELDKQVAIVFNLFTPEAEAAVPVLQEKLPLSRFCPSITLRAPEASCRQTLIEFILKIYENRSRSVELLPFLQRNEFYLLNVPMDDETPEGRFLRPQAMCVEYITRNWAYPVCYRMNLSAGRNPETSEAERKRFNEFFGGLKRRPKVVITDSQAIDLMWRWVPDNIGLTTFSIMMINLQSGGNLAAFVNGIRRMKDLKPGDRVLIAEACNHSRIGEDIGTVQIPDYFRKHYPGVLLSHNFGREFQENGELRNYSLIIHCGGCMIAPQKLSARLRDLDMVGVPYTNYGLVLSYLQGKTAFDRVLEPWGLTF
ncbi:MAG: 50S ribosome-binding GTPase [Candidatus Wallbacteria bacterium]|nr:50S ribosome-binding GTPase [Candidatus Wallbacteria bacterium]